MKLQLTIIINRTWFLMCILNIYLTMIKVVVNIKFVVVVSAKLTTTCHPVVRSITTNKHMWSLILLTTEPITTTNDHQIMVVNDF
jgi:hypothetical protein